MHSITLDPSSRGSITSIKEGFRISMEKTHKFYFVYRQNTPRSTNGETKKRRRFENQTAIFFMGTLQKIIELEI
jgi:hypothetical protein